MKDEFAVQTSLEIEPSEYSETIMNLLQDISKELDYDKDYPLELEVEVIGNYWYDKGKYYGETENCYPSHFELEIDKIYCNGKDISVLFIEKDFEKLHKECEIEVTENL